MHKGSCLCGAVTFEVRGTLPGPDVCHCGQCRKFSGHCFASTDVSRECVTIFGGDRVTWYNGQKARRGFCSVCGCSLFWDPLHHDWIGLAMGAFDTPTKTRVRVHIHVADKGDYYEIEDGLPQHPH